MSIQFHETIRGQRFFDGTLPRICNALEAIASELKRANDLADQNLSSKNTSENRNEENIK